VVVLVVSSADKQRQRFTQVQAPRVEVKTLLPACLVLIVDYAITGELRRDDDLASALVVRVWLGPRSAPLPAFK
jgi:hypothetical protein